jgi:Protein of unknown function (DUF4238)
VTRRRPSQTPADILLRIQELAPEASVNPVEDQHVISKVILRRFVGVGGEGDGLLYPFRLRYPNARDRLLGPDGCGKIKNFVAYASASAERLWKETKDKLPDALAAVDDGTLLSSPEHLATVKDAVALHYARSEATRIVHVRIFIQAAAASRNLWLADWRPRLEAAFYQAKGFYAVGDQALERFLDEMMQPNLDMAASGQLFRARIEDIYLKACAFVSSSGLELLTSGSREFLIGDVPALTIPRDGIGLGALGGTTLGDARTVIMPLGPRHLVALARTSISAELTPDQVATVNAYQVRGALEYVYLRPASGLEHFVRWVKQSKNPIDLGA